MKFNFFAQPENDAFQLYDINFYLGVDKSLSAMPTFFQ